MPQPGETRWTYVTNMAITHIALSSNARLDMTDPLSKDVRVRFAPSPTGLLHIGGLRTALYNFLFARKHGGTFVLRIEDTDRERFIDEAESDIRSSLEWSGLEYDEGPGVGGPHAPYYQSRRKDVYAKYADHLVDSGHAYFAFDTVNDLEAMRDRFATSHNPSPKYDAVTRMEMSNSLTLSDDEVRRRIENGDEYVIRLKVPSTETIRFTDLIRESVSFDASAVDDQVLVKSDGMPTYHLANVVDDHLMDITHVIRGEEWLSSTPKHILLYRYLGWERPQMAHLPLIMSPSGGKLSKRSAEELGIPVTVEQYREAGFEPEALINFLAFLGWNPGTEQEMFTLEELAEAFSFDRVGSSGVQFNLDKLTWYNEQYIRSFSVEELLQRARPYVEAANVRVDDDYLRAVVSLMQERITFVKDLPESAAYFFEDPETYDEKGVRKRWKDDSASLVRAYADRLEEVDAFDAEGVESVLRELADEREVGAGRIIHPTRLAVSGVSFGPSLFHMMEVIGREVCVRRMRRAADELG
ncbi:MAG: glutamate--tRNA ligase [Rhodothermales bacterium]